MNPSKTAAHRFLFVSAFKFELNNVFNPNWNFPAGPKNLSESPAECVLVTSPGENFPARGGFFFPAGDLFVIRGGKCLVSDKLFPELISTSILCQFNKYIVFKLIRWTSKHQSSTTQTIQLFPAKYACVEIGAICQFNEERKG